MDIVVTDEAARVALAVFTYRSQSRTEPGRQGFPAEAMRAAIEAALPHLTGVGEPLADPEFDQQQDTVRLATEKFYLTGRLDRLERLLHDQWAHRFDTAGEPDPHEVRAEALRSAARVMAPMTQSGAQNVIAIAKRFQAYIQDGV